VSSDGSVPEGLLVVSINFGDTRRIAMSFWWCGGR
jgi:hypothetical protein